jgi:hypothetical protein
VPGESGELKPHLAVVVHQQIRNPFALTAG